MNPSLFVARFSYVMVQKRSFFEFVFPPTMPLTFLASLSSEHFFPSTERNRTFLSFMLLQQHHQSSNPKTDGSEKNDIRLHFTNHLYLSPEYHYTHCTTHRITPYTKGCLLFVSKSANILRAAGRNRLILPCNQKSPVPLKSRYNRFSSIFDEGI